jgi:hypothetical protein
VIDKLEARKANNNDLNMLTRRVARGPAFTSEDREMVTQNEANKRPGHVIL